MAALLAPVAVLDRSHIVRSASRSFARLLGLEAKQVVGCPLTAIGDRALDLPPLQALVRQAFDNGALRPVEIQLGGPAGAGRTLQVSLHRVGTRRPPELVLVSLEDATDGQIAAAVVAEVPSPLAVIDGEGRVVAVNQAFGRAFRIKREQVEGRSLAEAAPIFDADPIQPAVESVRRGEKPSRTCEVLYERGPGRRQHYAVMVRRLRRGQAKGRILVSLTDITARKALSRALQSERDRLSDEVLSANRRLSSAEAALAAEAAAHRETEERLRHCNRLADIGRLTAGLAHELGTPLNVISARARMIHRGQSTGEAALEDARIVDEQVARMTELLRDVLGFARRRPRIGKSDLGESVQTAVRLLQATARSRGVVLEVVEPLPRATLAIQPGPLQQVLTNLLLNAVDAQPDGGRVRIGASLEEGERGRSKLKLTLDDDGPGLPADAPGLIFEPFFTTKPPGQGTGLGLSVCRGLLEEFGGSIEAMNRPDGGARFTVTMATAVDGGSR